MAIRSSGRPCTGRSRLSTWATSLGARTTVTATTGAPLTRSERAKLYSLIINRDVCSDCVRVFVLAYRRRTSSAHWKQDRLTSPEEKEHKRKMGWM